MKRKKKKKEEKEEEEERERRRLKKSDSPSSHALDPPLSVAHDACSSELNYVISWVVVLVLDKGGPRTGDALGNATIYWRQLFVKLCLCMTDGSKTAYAWLLLLTLPRLNQNNVCR